MTVPPMLALALLTTLAPACLQRSRPATPPPPTPPPTPAARTEVPDYEAHVERLRQRLPHEGFHVVVQPPFVVVGDQPAAEVRARATRTVKWAVDLLKKDFFAQDPDHIIDIWLFKDAASYRKHALELFGDRPSTRYGYYSARHRALVMDISTGGGTLVHEIVHPFVRANFPQCPAWLNEGLGSLYEQCREQDGKIVGLTNWRLRGLQQAIRQNRVPTFEALLRTTDDEFYSEDRGTNYAQARYLLYWLQEHGKLRSFFRAFHRDHAEDPTGLATLKRALATEDLRKWQDDWEAWVLGLRF